MNLIITIQATDKHGHVLHESSKEVANFMGRDDSFSVIKGWFFEKTLFLKNKFK